MSMKLNNLYYPPGGMLIWIIITIELLTFIPGLFVFLYERSQNPTEFAKAAQGLNSLVGTLNTAILLTSGWFMANTITSIRSRNEKAAFRWLSLTIFGGFIFLLIKGIEYYGKSGAETSIQAGGFYTMYWLITGFHYIHVLTGVGILLAMLLELKNKFATEEYLQNIESSSVFWHMCDLIWIFVFPVFYLLK